MGVEHILILTPTARLARAVLKVKAAERVASGQASWHPPLVLSFSGWLGRLRDDWLLESDHDRVPINSSQSLMLWRSLIDRDIFIGEPRVAELAQSAWRTIHEYALPHPSQWAAAWLTEDQRQFRLWCERFEAQCRERGLIDEWTFAAQLPELLRQGRLKPPDRVELHGFDLPPTPLQQALFEALGAAGCPVEPADRERRPPTEPKLFEYASPDDELRAAATWARAQLAANPAARIGIVVPDLQARLSRVERVFRQTFDPPGFALRPGCPRAWHVSLGHPLASWPLVEDALALLSLDPWRISQPQATRLLRSPFLKGWDQEAPARDRVIARLARHLPYWLTGAELMRQVTDGGASALGRRLAEWQQLRRQSDDRALPSAWARSFLAELSSLGFGHGRALDSREFQTLKRWQELLEEFSALDLIADRPLARRAALARLRERATAVVFRERNPGAAVEILGVEEALGERFDALRITTLHQEQWPPPARRDALIPARLQATLPRATSDNALERARLELAGLKTVSELIVGSYARGLDDQPLLLTGLLDGPVETPDPDTANPEAMEPDILPADSHAPAMAGTQSTGGTGVLQAQSDCPFKAFAIWRLGARDSTPPRPGLDVRDRGSLLHRALELFWRDLPDQAALLALDPTALAARVATATEQAMEAWQQRHRLGLSKAAARLEKICLKRALMQWLALEKERPPFRISSLETEVEMQFGPLRLTGKIDRVDTLEDGSTLLIDYKTGAASRSDWAPAARLSSVQLPAYAVNLHPQPQALAFAVLKPDQVSLSGLAGMDTGIQSVDALDRITRQPFKDIASWDVLLDEWQTHLEALAEQFASGQAEVDPRKPTVCRYCHLTALCRIKERSQWLGEEDEHE